MVGFPYKNVSPISSTVHNTMKSALSINSSMDLAGVTQAVEVTTCFTLSGKVVPVVDKLVKSATSDKFVLGFCGDGQILDVQDDR